MQILEKTELKAAPSVPGTLQTSSNPLLTAILEGDTDHHVTIAQNREMRLTELRLLSLSHVNLRFKLQSIWC